MVLPVTLAIAKTAAKLSRLLGRGGGQALPGLVAEQLDPNLIGKLAAALPGGVILVTGTNGKTTTTKLIAGILEAKGERVLTNSTGSNLKRGVASALIGAASASGKLEATIGLFEVDEASLRQVAPLVKPSHIVVLNLFRDQLDRYGELDTTAAVIGEGIAATEAELHLNSDDPLVAGLASYARAPEKVKYFGIEGLPASAATAHETATDSDRCPVCRARLEFSRVFYGHIGHYRCREGHFSRPQPGVALTSVESADLQGARFTVAVYGKRHAMQFALPGTYNLYNALAAVSVADSFRIETERSGAVLARTQAAFGRVEKVELLGRTLYLLLVKNPAGFTQVLETFLLGRRDLRILMAINDNAADGRDVSWLWDVPLEALRSSDPVIFTAGIRGADMALRLHYAGIRSNVMDNFERAIHHLVQHTPRGGTAYILPSYTAMLQIRKILAAQISLPEAGE